MNLIYKHPIALLFLGLFTLLCFDSVSTSIEIKESVKQGMEVHMREWGGVLEFLFAAIFFFISCGYAIAKPKETKFYLWLIAVIISEAIVTLNFDKFLS